MSKKKKPGELSDNDKAIWNKVAESVTPLDDRPAAKPLPKVKRVHIERERELPQEWATAGGPVPETLIDRKSRRRISSGHTDIDRVLDLHGNTSDTAYTRLRQEIINSVKMGHRTVLIITGKGGKRHAQNDGAKVRFRTRDELDSGTGVLKRLVPEWLSSPDLRPFVISYDTASQSHGGEGALYVKLRNKAPKG